MLSLRTIVGHSHITTGKSHLFTTIGKFHIKEAENLKRKNIAVHYCRCPQFCYSSQSRAGHNSSNNNKEPEDNSDLSDEDLLTLQLEKEQQKEYVQRLQQQLQTEQVLRDRYYDELERSIHKQAPPIDPLASDTPLTQEQMAIHTEQVIQKLQQQSKMGVKQKSFGEVLKSFQKAQEYKMVKKQKEQEASQSTGKGEQKSQKSQPEKPVKLSQWISKWVGK